MAGLVINFIADQPKAVNEMRRVARSLGVVGAYVYAGEMQMMRHFWDAAVAMDRSAASLMKVAVFPFAILNGWQIFFGEPVSGT